LYQPDVEENFLINSKHIREGQDPNLDRKYKLWRIGAWLGTWLAYAGLYLCRKTISVAPPEMMKEFGWEFHTVTFIMSGYFWAYAVGQFLNGVLGDKLGTRGMLAIGFVTTVIMNALFGFSSVIVIFFLLWTINGFAQSTGWPSVIKGMSNWFSVRERGKVMGPWGTCYTVGDVVGTALAAFIIGHVAVASVMSADGTEVTYANWRWVFWTASIALAFISIIVFFILRNKPEDVGLPPIAEYHNQIPASPETDIDKGPEKVNLWENTKEVLSQGPIWILGITYFGIKFIRYTFMFLVTTYLATERGFQTDTAGYISTLFALVGILGTFVASYLSDTVFKSRRAPISVIMLIGLAFSLVFFWKSSIALIPIAMGIVGFMTYGPDFVVSAVAVMDFGSRKGASTAAGFVNGIGSFGPAIMTTVVGIVQLHYGWDGVFVVLIILSLACAALMSTLWNKVGTN
jgi:MFS transporter, OPA family, glycerol-3-phosphate transporter